MAKDSQLNVFRGEFIPSLLAAAQNLIQLSPVGIFQTDLQGRCTYVNHRWCEITGLNAGQALGEGWAAALHPDDRARISELWYQAAKDNRAFEAEYRFLHPDGSVIWVKGQAVAEHTDNDQATGYIGTITDISGLMLAERALVESQRAYSTMISNLPGMVYRCKNDPDWTLEFANEGCLQLTGYPPSDLIRKKINYADLIHPDDRQFVWDEVQKGVCNNRPYQITYRITAKDGKDKWVWEQGLGIFSVQGELLALEGFITDISDRKYAENALQEVRAGLERLIEERTTDLAASNRRLQQEIIERRQAEIALLESERSYQTLAKNIPGIVYRIYMHENMRIQFFNDMLEEITGYTEKEIRHMDDLDILIHPDDYIRAKEILTTAIREKQPFDNEYRVRCKDKSLRNLVEHGRPIRDLNNKILYIEGVIFDITQRKYTEERRLADLRQQRDTLVREVHHRIKNNLQGVVGLFNQYANEFPEVKGIVETAITQVNSMAMVYGLHSTSVDGNILFGELLRSISNSVKALLGDNLVIEADHDRLNTYVIPQEESVAMALILNELLINAVKHNDSGSHTVVVSVIHRNRESSLEVYIKNKGGLVPGFDYNQGCKTGMGLSMIRSLMPCSGAELSINSHDGMVTARLLLEHPVITAIG